jgi:undecaprenyl-diphosphatase
MTSTTAPAPGDPPTASPAAVDGEGGVDGDLLDRSRSVRHYERSPGDLLRLLGIAGLTLAVVLLVKLLAEATGGFQASLVELVAVRSADLLRVLEGLLQLTYAAVMLITLALPLLTRRLRIFLYVFTVDVACGLLMGLIDAWIGFEGATNAVAEAAGVEPGPLPDATTVAQVAASIVVFSPFVTRRWRKVLLALFGVLVLLQLLVSVYPPAATAVALALGPAVGTAALLLYGRPVSRPTVAAITAALVASGLDVGRVEPAAVDARGSTPYLVTLRDGTRVFAKVMGATERAADILFRAYRRLRLKNVGDERPDSSLRRTVEHEALVSLKARDVGVSTPRLRALARVGDDAFLLSYDLIPGASLDKVAPERLTDEVLRAIWEEVDLLRRSRIAHRDLRLANVFLDDEDRPWLIDFGFAEVAADETLLRADVAQLLTSLAVAVGIDRALDAAIAGIGAPAVGSAIGRLQTVALSGATQSALRSQPDLLAQLRAEVAERCGVSEPQLDPLTRFRPSNGVMLAASAVVVFVGLPLWAGLGEVVDTLAGGSWSHVATLVAAAVAVELLGAWALASAAGVALPALATLWASVATTFASTTAPARLGGRSLQARYLERHGVDHDAAGEVAGFLGAASTVSQLLLLVVFLVWAGRGNLDSAPVDRPEALLGGLVVVAGLAGVSLAVGPLRRRTWGRMRQRAGSARRGMRRLESSPTRVAATVAAVILAALADVGALQASGEVMDLGLDLATVGVVLLAGRTIATAAPTPGHILAIEAVLTAGLVAAGAPFAVAVPSVLLYRLATFWAPLALGPPAFAWLRDRQHV